MGQYIDPCSYRMVSTCMVLGNFFANFAFPLSITGCEYFMWFCCSSDVLFKNLNITAWILVILLD
jgi:hypothetical protein